MAKQVRKWESSNGTPHDTKVEAEMIDIRNAFTDGIFDVFLTNNGITRKEIAHTICENAELIQDLITPIIRSKKAIAKNKIKIAQEIQTQLASAA